ncbi:hypothetical protein [Haloplasma contractile]|uniref:Uncharacterized protein n=1 Tax=Haloplasma contractile SSD-17B TaxID=1033810 RepID=F7Q2Q2_9MOLU|nr:hypothetical protein [Haloplasma contractile]ERJ11756.1 hypothetical protein HLPCO_002239 [Haloplasma contractile SSD-17B]
MKSLELSNNINRIEEFILPDSEIGIIQIDYTNHNVVIPMKIIEPRFKVIEKKLSFENVKKFNIEILEPWGEGIYINNYSYKIEVINNEEFISISIILNSGDKIVITSKRLSFLDN